MHPLPEFGTPHPTSSACPAEVAATPLTWWCRLPPAAFDLAAQRRLRAAVLATPPLPLAGWRAACNADPAAAIGVAIAVLGQLVVRPDRLDPAMSAVALCALLGDPACASLVVHVLGRRSCRRACLDSLRLAHAWRRPFASRQVAAAGPGR